MPLLLDMGQLVCEVCINYMCIIWNTDVSRTLKYIVNATSGANMEAMRYLPKLLI